MNLSAVFRLLEAVKASLSPSQLPTLLKIQQMYEKNLLPYRFVYSISEQGHKPRQLKLEFNKRNFCHLFSVGSIVEDVTPDHEAFSGIRGWENIQQGRITFKTLRQMNQKEFSYYQQEFNLAEKLIETAENPDIVAYDPAKVPGSRLQCDYLLYKVFGSKVIHLGISHGDDGLYFPRSYFVRDVSKDKTFPSKYIAPMKHFRVKVRKTDRKS